MRKQSKMDSQLKNYQVLKNGKPTGVTGTLDFIVKAIQSMEKSLDRFTQHSPYTIAKI